MKAIIFTIFTASGMVAGLNQRERKAFILHFAYSLLEGIIAGLLLLNEFVFVKSLQGSNYQLAILFQVSTAVFILLVFINEWLRRIKNKRKMLRWAAIISRLPLVLLIFYPRSVHEIGSTPVYHYIFLAIFLVYYLGNTVIWPTVNLLLKTSYRNEEFSRLFSHATIFYKIVIMLTAFFYGWLLDMNHFAFVYIFPVAAILGVVSVFLLSLIPYENTYQSIKSGGFFSSVKVSIAGMVKILKENRPFFDFQAGFMLYGIGFMISYPLIVLFFEHELNLNYSTIALYKNSFNLIAIFMLPFFGRLMSRTDPRIFASIPFAAMLLYLIFLIITPYFSASVSFWEYKLYFMLIPFIFFNGVFTASMVLTWYIGSAWFCTPEEAGSYQSVHLVLTAVRSLFAPLMGIAIFEAWGFNTSFVISMVFLALSVSYMIWSARNNKLNTR